MENMGIIRIPLLGTTALVMLVASLSVEAWQFNVVHKYAHLEGSPANTDDGSMSSEYFEMLVEHHHQRRRLLDPAVFGLEGNVDTVGLYYTPIGLGTPARVFWVDVDTGSDLLWVTCTPCSGCPTSSPLPNVTVNPYDPNQSSTETTLLCSSTKCPYLSPNCNASAKCTFESLYGDGTTAAGTILTDVFSFYVALNTTSVEVATAKIVFGCGSKISGFQKYGVGGLMGFSKQAVSVPQQLVSQGLAANQFAHCLEGDSKIGGGFYIITTFSDQEDLVFTPQIPKQTHYNVGLQNIAVNGKNVTKPASFEIKEGKNDGVIFDSGTTLAAVAEPAFTSFVTAVKNAVTIQSVQSSSGDTCWQFSGDIATKFPSVTLFFDGGAMNLGPTNYLLSVTDSSGTPYQCLGWINGTLPSSNSSVTIWGDIVLKDQLIVYDNDQKRIGWKPFKCT